jgi:flagellar hook-basal body complex protein FliE
MAVDLNAAVGAYQAAVKRIDQAPGNPGKAAENQAAGADFSSMVQKFASDAVATGENSERQTAAAAAGKANIDQVVVAVAEAELTLSTVVSIRDRVIEAYREIARMPL